jgi:hypothetical protein
MKLRQQVEYFVIPAKALVEKAYFPRNPVMPSRTKETIIYKVNQACRESGYLCGTPECLRTLLYILLFLFSLFILAP